MSGLGSDAVPVPVVEEPTLSQRMKALESQVDALVELIEQRTTDLHSRLQRLEEFVGS